jgi:hypothetical protein
MGETCQWKCHWTGKGRCESYSHRSSKMSGLEKDSFCCSNSLANAPESGKNSVRKNNKSAVPETCMILKFE